jgi:hypothetical protein
MEARGHALLDRRTPLAAAPPRRRTLRLIAGGVIGATLEVLALRFGWFDRLGHVALLFLPAYYLVVAVHELGHLAAALFVRFEWREFSTDPLVVRRKAARIRWRFVPARLLAGGQVQAVPPDALNLRRRFLILLAGGPIATALVFAALAPFPWTDWSTAVCVANLLAAATSWLPYYTGGYVTDEKAILLLSGGSAEGELLLAILRVMALDTRGVRPRDWGAETIARLRLASESTLGVAASILLLSHALDGNDGDAIAEEVERALPRAGGGVPLHRRMIYETAAYTQGIFRRNAELAAAWLADARAVKGVVAEADWDADSLGAVAWASGKHSEAEAQFERALARLARQPGASGSVKASRERLLRLTAILRQVTKVPP